MNSLDVGVFQVVFLGGAVQQSDFLWSQADVLDASSRWSVHPLEIGLRPDDYFADYKFPHAECVKHS